MAVSSELNKVFFDFPFLVPEYFALVKILNYILANIIQSSMNAIVP